MNSNLDEEENKYICLKLKIIVLGDSNVGKTCSIVNYVESIYDSDHIPTIGIGLSEKIIIKNDYIIKLEIWDTAGQERFRALTKKFFNEVQGIVFMYDITEKKSYSDIGNWINDAKNNSDNFKSIILGNKKDLESNRIVQYSDLEKAGFKYKMPYMETSAKTGENINEAFDKLIDEILDNKSKKEIIQKYAEGDNNKSFNLKNQKHNKNKKKNCC